MDKTHLGFYVYFKKKKCVLYAGIYSKYCSFLLNRLPEWNKEQTKECYQF